MAEEKLIEAVRKHRELYDTRDGNYMKTKLKNKIWSELAKDLDLRGGKEAKTLWLKLRGSYRDARRRQMKCLKSGAAPENIKPWRFQKQMSFLDSYMSAGPREGNINVKSDEDSQIPLTAASEEILESEGVEGSNSIVNEEHEKSYIDNTKYKDEESSSGITSAAPHTSSTSVAHRKQPKNRKQDDFRILLKRSVQLPEERARERAEERTLQLNSTTDDPLYNFFISMYQLTKSMPFIYQHKIRGQLFRAVSQAEEDIMNISSRPPSTLSSPSHGYSASSSSTPCSSYSHHPSPQTFSDPQQQFF